MNTEQINPEIALVEKHASELGEHFDSVQIFVTRYEPATADGTIQVCVGTGNWFARYGQVRDWTVKEEERTRADVRNDNKE